MLGGPTVEHLAYHRRTSSVRAMEKLVDADSATVTDSNQHKHHSTTQAHTTRSELRGTAHGLGEQRSEQGFRTRLSARRPGETLLEPQWGTPLPRGPPPPAGPCLVPPQIRTRDSVAPSERAQATQVARLPERGRSLPC